jgi:hypothetical protein
MKLEYKVQIWREDGQFIAHAMPLDVASSGKTPEAARQAVDEEVKLFIAIALRARHVERSFGRRRLPQRAW